MDMDSLADYYIHQGGGGGSSEQLDDLFGPMYVGSPYVQRGHGIGSFLAGLFRSLKPWAAKHSVREHRFSRILGTNNPRRKVKDIVADRLAESAQRLVTKLRGGGGLKRKRKTSNTPPLKKKKEGSEGRYNKRHILVTALIQHLDGMACTAIRYELDIFARRPVHSAVLSPRVTHYKPFAPLNQSELEFVIPDDGETYVHLDIHISVRGKLVALYGSTLDPTNSTLVVNNLLH
jgi:hypothetical protein